MTFSKKIEFILDTDKKIFKIENFLNQELYKNIQNNFPITTDDKIKLQGYSNDKSVLLRDAPEVQGKEYLKELDNIILSDEFFKFFTNFFFYKASFVQNNYKRMLKYLRPIKRVYKKDKHGIVNSKIFLNYEYSFIKNNGQIVPHVDALRKYQSLMLYFPDPKFDDSNYGTSFWQSEVMNWDNEHLLNKEDMRNFKNNNNIIYQTPFKENCLYGFLRNDYSWHSVEPNDIDKEYIRRSININFYYTN